jgi:hypothetical protein
MLRPLVTPPLYDPIRIELLDGPLVRVLEPIRWRGPYPDTVPGGFVSDGGSKPAITWPFVGHPLSRRLVICYFLHDLDLARGMPWREATRRFNARVHAVGCHPLRRWAEVGAVTLRGWWRRLTR